MYLKLCLGTEQNKNGVINMNLKVLFMILTYYSMLSLFFLMGASFGLYDDYDVNVNLNSSGISSDEIDQGGLFGSGISFSRFAGMISFGVGLPDDTPNWFNVIFIFWQTIVTILALGFVISSIWNG